MKRLVAVGVSLAVLLFASAALASPPTRAHLRSYRTAYAQARAKFGAHAVGCNLVARRGSCHVRATDEALQRSLGVLGRMLAPPPAPVAATTYSSTTSTHHSYPEASSASATVPASSSYEQCIISAESGGNSQAVNGKYSGIGQWSQTQWQADGGGRYSSSPTGASYSQQEQILSGEGRAGMGAQQGRYDPCGP